MKKIIILSLLIASFALSAVAFAETTKTVKTANQAVVLSCVSSAVATRESEIQTAFSSFSTTMTSAFSKRATDLLAAWTITDKTARNSAIKTATTNFKQTSSAAKKTYNTARQAAWSKFSAARVSCKAPSTGENPAIDSIQ